MLRQWPAADIWEKFKSRFRIPQILEFYAATEGNFSLYNCEGKTGRDRPDSVVPRASLSRGAGQVRLRGGRAGA